MEKIDLVKKHKSYYTAKEKPTIVEIEKAHFLSIAGKGDPSSELYTQKIQALYPVAYTLKFACKAKGKDFAIAKLEGLWWYDEIKFRGMAMKEAPLKIPRSEWQWQLLIRMPEFVTLADVHASIHTVSKKKNSPYVNEVDFITLNEGSVVQMLHVGRFSEEPRTLEIMMAFMKENGLGRNGLHHEIYLSDFNKTAPEKLKTILREPVRKI